MEIRVSTTEELTEADRRSITRVCIAAHDNLDFANLFTYIPSGGRHFLAYDGSDLVSHAVVTTRWLEPGGAGPLRTAWVDAVSTLPAVQGRGFASAAMRALAAGIEDFEIGGLQTDLRGFYERFGWQFWRGPLAGRGDDSTLIPTPDQHGVMILRLSQTPPLDLDTGMTIEKQPGRIWE
jgi:aminoglycoside 2'-N-acetyltransferase I